MKFSNLVYAKFDSLFKQASLLTKTPPERVDQIINIYKSAQVFLIEDSFYNGEETIFDNDNILLDEPLPFKNCYFEFGDPDRFLISGFLGDKEFNLSNLLVSEISPGKILCIGLALVDKVSIIYSGTIEPQTAHTQPEMQMLFGILKKICQHINRCNLGIEYIHKTVNLSYPKKCSHKLESFIRLSPKIHKAFPSPLFASKIDWTVSWWVRGHWRKLDNGTGKDRDGIYNTNGFTWVTEHKRGDLAAPLKTHIYTLENRA